MREGVLPRAHSFCLYFLIAAPFLTRSPEALAQTPPLGSSENSFYARRNTFGFFGAYSNDSSHILLGYAKQRKLLDIGVSYSRSLYLSHIVNWQYDGELLPVALESDPMSHVVENFTTPAPATYSYNSGPIVTCAPATTPITFIDPATGVSYSGTVTVSCYGRRWIDGEALSPIGFRWNFLPARSLQPFADGHGGYMYTTQAVPVDEAGSFNFTFDIGAGLEVYRTMAKSIRVEYRYHHISNHGTATLNPGIDNGLFQVTYCFRLGHR
jgi:hypothetical protein